MTQSSYSAPKIKVITIFTESKILFSSGNEGYIPGAGKESKFEDDYEEYEDYEPQND